MHNTSPPLLRFLFILAFLLVMLPQTSRSQVTAYRSNVQVGVKGGLEYNRFRLWRSREYRGIYTGTGWNAGMFVRLNAKERFSFQMELLLSLDQGSGSAQEAEVNEFSDFQLSLFRLPLLMQIRLGKGELQPMLAFGPSLNILLNLEGEIISNQKDWLPEVIYSPLTVGISAGGGLAWRPNDGSIELLLDGRFNLITLNIFDNTVTMQVMVGVGF